MIIRTALDKPRISTILVLIVGLLILSSTLLVVQQDDFTFLPISEQVDLENGLMIGNDDITLKFEGQKLTLNSPVVYKENRYYLPFVELISKMGGLIKREGQYLYVHFLDQDITINLPEQSFSKDNVKFSFTVEPEGGDFLINLFDLCQLFNLVTDWDVEDHVLGLYINKKPPVQAPLTTRASEKQALIRLEDISTGGPYYTTEALTELRTIADYLYEVDVPFHVAWVPRYVDPTKSIDRSIADQYSMLNADFVFTLDYFIYRNGMIGLHGYTHQYGNTISLIGTEFRSSYEKSSIPDSNNYIRERLTNAIHAANKLGIPYSFFEAPHNVLSPKTLRLAEHYFNYIYQSYPDIPDKIVQHDKFLKQVIFIPTPLGYIHGQDDLERVFMKIKKQDLFASFYFHPFLEFHDISITRDGRGYPEINYSRDSTLHRLVEEFKNYGYTFSSIHRLSNTTMKKSIAKPQRVNPK